MSEIIIGCIATDISSGFEGTVVSRNELFNGNVQFSVQPKAIKGAEKLPEAYSIDAASLKFKSKGVSANAITPQITDVQVGDEVEDIISGHTGIATTKTTFLNGCVYFDVVKKGNDAKKIESTAMFLSCTRLKKTKAKTLAPITTVKGAKPTGGPSTRAQRAN
jgi:hypothetical protein